MIEIFCQNCGQRMEIADQYAGQTGKCKNCGKQIIVPASEPVSAFKQIHQAQTPGVPYKWIAAGAAIVVVLALGVYILVSRDTPAPSSRGASAPASSSPQGTTVGRIVEFPNDRRVGAFYLRNKVHDGSPDMNWGRPRGWARGPKAVPEGKEAGLYIGPDHPVDLFYLKNFAPNDLDFLIIHHPSMTDEQLQHVAHLTGIKMMQVEFGGIGDAGLRHLSGLTQVVSLHLHGSNITDAGIEAIMGMTDLQLLHIAGSRVTDVGIRRLKALPSLVHITLSSDQITAPMVMALKEVPSIISLAVHTDITLYGESFSLADRPLTPSTIRLLADLDHLERFGLSGYRNDDSLIPALAQLTQVKAIVIGYSSITPAGMDELKRALPNCIITP